MSGKYKNSNLMTGSPIFALYGSLRAGMGNYHRFAGAMEHLETVRVPGFRMYALRNYPYVVLSANPSDSVVVEIVQMTNPETEREMVEFERSVGYDLHYFFFNGRRVGIFIFNVPGAHPWIESGDWVEFLSRKQP